LLKKIKNKVNKTVSNSGSSSEKTEEEKTSSEKKGDNNSSTAANDEDSKSVKWCEGLDATGGGSHNDGGPIKDGVE